MTEPKRPLKVFLCHASADKPKVRELYRSLKRRGVLLTYFVMFVTKTHKCV